MQACTIFDCEWHCYHQGVIVDNKVYVLNKENSNPEEASSLIYGPWETMDLPLMLFFIQHNLMDTAFEDACELKWGFFNLSTGEVVVPPIYDYLECFCSHTLARFRLNQKEGHIDKQGNAIGGIVWDEVHRFRDDVALCAVRDGSLWGYINKKGEIVLEPQFEEAGEWQFLKCVNNPTLPNNKRQPLVIAKVKKAEKYGFINDQGRYFLEPQFDKVGEWQSYFAMPPCANGSFTEMAQWLSSQIGHVAWVCTKRKYGFINDTGQYLIEPIYDGARDFWQGYYAPVKMDRKWGFVDRTGHLVVPPTFSDVGEYQFKIHMVQLDKTWGILTPDLQIIMPETGLRYVIYNGERISFRRKRVASRRKVKM